MSRTWTPAQLEAINKEGTNIIVSAGAGSGKTAVLTERVLTKLRNGLNINQLLILTFTKAAALEMKERIRQEIKKAPTLKKQEELLESSYITTFDSYSLFVVNKYHYLLNLPNNVGIGDENVINLTKLKLMDSIFDDMYEQQDESFVKLITTFCVKDDNSLKSQILKIYNKLEIRSDCSSYLKDYINNHFSDEKINADIRQFEKEILSLINNLSFDLQNHSYLFSEGFYSILEASLDGIFSSSNYNELYLNFITFKNPRIAKGESGEAKVYKEDLKKQIDKIMTYCPYSNSDEIKQTILQTKTYVEVIIKILLQLNEQVNNYKMENLTFSFSDIALYAIKIVSDHQEIATEISNSFYEILLDEYQDTSDLQEIFINKIANNNVYMVGDVKQSIYRFRNANPSLFMGKYNQYAHGHDGYKIDLTKNFRSRKEVITNINDIFKLIMDDEIGNANYAIDHMMEFGNTNYEVNKPNHNYNYKFLFYQKDENYSNYKDFELEAFIIANDIKNKIDTEFLIFDHKLMDYRPFKYSDVTILIDRSSKFTTYRKIFDYFNIPLKLLKDEDISGSTLVKIIRNMLLLLISYRHHSYNQQFKHALVSVLRSFIYELNDNDIYQIIKNKHYQDNPFYQDIKSLLTDLDRMSLKDILLSIYSLTKVEEKLIKIGSVHNNSAILEYLVSIGQTLSINSYTISDFVQYFDQIYVNDLSIVASITTSSDDVCLMMTIHKSKGLEFSICYFPGLSAKFNFSDLKERFIYNKRLGIITPYFDEGVGTTIYKHLLELGEKDEEISEKIRLLYVALTRCKEQMIFVGKEFELKQSELQDDKVSSFTRKNYASFAHILKSVYPFINHYSNDEIIDLNSLNLSTDYNEAFYDYSNYIKPNETKLITKKVNVDTKLVSTKSFSKKITTLITKQELKNIELGLTMHSILESLDFRKIDLEVYNLNPFIAHKLESFLKLDLFKNSDQAKIYQEYEFMYEDDGDLKNGIIDLLIEDDTTIKIIDYKLKNINDIEYLNQLKGYANYIQTLSNKQIDIYLYSFLDETLEKLALTV